MDADAIGQGRDGRPGIAQLFNDGFHVLDAPIFEHNVATGCSHSTQKSTGLNAVRHHLVRATMELRHALNTDAAAAVALNFRAHFDQHFSQVGNLGLLRRILKNGFAFGQGGGHEEILCASDSDHVGGNARALQAVAALWQLGKHVAVFNRDFGPHGDQPLDVLVYRAGANGTAAGQRDLGLAKPRQQRPQRQHRCTHGLDQLVRRLGFDRIDGLKRHAAALAMRLGLHAHVVEQAAHGGHVLQARHVQQVDRLVGQQRGAHLRQCGVFGTGYLHLAMELATPANQ